jgi:hypothetical protein
VNALMALMALRRIRGTMPSEPYFTTQSRENTSTRRDE